MKYIKLFESWKETGDDMGYKWEGSPSINFREVETDGNEVPDLIIDKDGESLQIKSPGIPVSDLDYIDAELLRLGNGWRLPTIEEYEYIDKLIQEEKRNGEEWEYDYIINTDERYWSGEKAYEDDEPGYENNDSRYAWDFKRHKYVIVNPLSNYSLNVMFIKNH
jgi:formylglycine-generating enzyme required for sulfatase activity